MPFVEALDAAARARLKADVAADGFASFGPPALDDATLTLMLEEAQDQKSSGWGRPQGHAIDHRTWRAEIGPVTRQFLKAPETIGLLQEVVARTVTPSFEATCVTYYEGPIDFLGKHRDRPDTCACTLILYLAVTWPDSVEPSVGLELHVFAPDDEAGSTPVRRIQTRANVLVLGRGADVPHCRPSLNDGESVVALTACFSVSPASQIHSPGNSIILTEEGFAELQQGHHAEAGARFEAALQRDPGTANAWSGLGFVHWSAGCFEDALTMFMRATEYDGNNASHWSNIGLCLRELQLFDRAEHAFAVALMLDPSYAPALNEWANVLQDQNRWSEAVPIYQRSLAVDPTRAVVHHNLGVAYVRLNEPVLAVQAFMAALDRDPSYSHSLEELGILCATGGLLNQALDFLNRAATPRAAALIDTLTLS